MKIFNVPIQFLSTVVTDCFPTGGNFLEVGVSRGESTIGYGKLIKEKGGHLYLLDWFRGSLEDVAHQTSPFYYNPEGVDEKQQCLIDNLTEAGIIDIVTIINNDSRIAWEQPPIKDLKFDIIFIDGGHTYDIVKLDIEHYFPLCKEGGVFLGHDYNQPDVARAVNEKFPGKHKVIWDADQGAIIWIAG